MNDIIRIFLALNLIGSWCMPYLQAMDPNRPDNSNPSWNLVTAGGAFAVNTAVNMDMVYAILADLNDSLCGDSTEDIEAQANAQNAQPNMNPSWLGQPMDVAHVNTNGDLDFLNGSIDFDGLNEIDFDADAFNTNADQARAVFTHLDTGEQFHEALIDGEDNDCGVRVFGYANRQQALYAVQAWGRSNPDRANNAEYTDLLARLQTENARLEVTQAGGPDGPGLIGDLRLLAEITGVIRGVNLVVYARSPHNFLEQELIFFGRYNNPSATETVYVVNAPAYYGPDALNPNPLAELNHYNRLIPIGENFNPEPGVLANLANPFLTEAAFANALNVFQANQQSAQNIVEEIIVESRKTNQKRKRNTSTEQPAAKQQRTAKHSKPSNQSSTVSTAVSIPQTTPQDRERVWHFTDLIQGSPQSYQFRKKHNGIPIKYIKIAQGSPRANMLVNLLGKKFGEFKVSDFHKSQQMALFMIWQALKEIASNTKLGHLPILFLNTLLQQGTSDDPNANLSKAYSEIILDWTKNCNQDPQLNLTIGAILKLSQLSFMIERFFKGNTLPPEAIIGNWVKILMAIKQLLEAIKKSLASMQPGNKSYILDNWPEGFHSLHALLEAFKQFQAYKELEEVLKRNPSIALRNEFWDKNKSVNALMNFKALKTLRNCLVRFQPQPDTPAEELLALLNEWLGPNAPVVPVPARVQGPRVNDNLLNILNLPTPDYANIFGSLETPATPIGAGIQPGNHNAPQNIPPTSTAVSIPQTTPQDRERVWHFTDLIQGSPQSYQFRKKHNGIPIKYIKIAQGSPRANMLANLLGNKLNKFQAKDFVKTQRMALSMIWEALTKCISSKKLGKLPIDPLNILLQQGTSDDPAASLTEDYANIILKWEKSCNQDPQLNLTIGAILKLSQLSFMIERFFKGNTLPPEAIIGNWVKILMAIKKLIVSIKPNLSYHIIKAHLPEDIRENFTSMNDFHLVEQHLPKDFSEGFNSLHALLQAFKKLPAHSALEAELKANPSIAIEDVFWDKNKSVEALMNIMSLQKLRDRLKSLQPDLQPEPDSPAAELLALLNEWLDPNASVVPVPEAPQEEVHLTNDNLLHALNLPTPNFASNPFDSLGTPATPLDTVDLTQPVNQIAAQALPMPQPLFRILPQPILNQQSQPLFLPTALPPALRNNPQQPAPQQPAPQEPVSRPLFGNLPQPKKSTTSTPNPRP